VNAGRLLLVCLGGAFGSGARYLMSVWMLGALGPGFPYWTLSVNLIGSLALTALMYAASKTDAVSPDLQLTLATGVLGGFTTYSAFGYETFRFLLDGALGTAAIYVVVTVFGCLCACALGFAGARAVIGG
jgi:CrcB protein